MKKNKKTLIFILVIILIICIFQPNSFGEKIDVNDWNPNVSSTTTDSGLAPITGKILGIITNVGSVVSVLTLVIIGIKFMLGSVEEKAQYKEALKPYLVGAILLFSVINIVEILYKIGFDLV